MDTYDLDTNMQDLTRKVSQFTNIPVEKSTSNMTSSIHDIWKKPVVIYYVSTVIAITVILFLLKPVFITHEISIDGDLPVKKLHMKKLLIAVIGISLPVIYFIHMYSTR